MRIMEFQTIKFAAGEMAKSQWAALKPMLDSLSDEEIEKIPDIEPGAREVAERFGITDIIDRPPLPI
jgi:hypothetical protein